MLTKKHFGKKFFCQASNGAVVAAAAWANVTVEMRRKLAGGIVFSVALSRVERRFPKRGLTPFPSTPARFVSIVSSRVPVPDLSLPLAVVTPEISHLVRTITAFLGQPKKDVRLLVILLPPQRLSILVLALPHLGRKPQSNVLCVLPCSSYLKEACNNMSRRFTLIAEHAILGKDESQFDLNFHVVRVFCPSSSPLTLFFAIEERAEREKNPLFFSSISFSPHILVSLFLALKIVPRFYQ